MYYIIYLFIVDRCLRVSIAMRDTMTMATLKNENISLGLAYSSEIYSVIIMQHTGRPGAERWPRVAHLDPQTVGRGVSNTRKA